MFIVPVKELLEAGVHFGCRASRWNPKMAPFIFGRRNLIHIIDLKETLRGLIKATTFLQRLVAQGEKVLFVGTKRQAQGVIQECAARVNMPCVSERWLGGMLTNFDTIRSRLKRLDELETMERDGTMRRYSKKRIASLMREKRKIFRNLDGVRHMERRPGAVIVVDPRKEHNAVQEATKLGIPVVAILDTDCDPDPIDIPIPGNDDSMRSILVLLNKLTEATQAGLSAYAQSQEEEKKRQAEEEAGRAQEKKKQEEQTRRRAAEQAALKAAQERLRKERAAQSQAAPREPERGESAARTPASAVSGGGSSASPGTGSKGERGDPPGPESEV